MEGVIPWVPYARRSWGRFCQPYRDRLRPRSMNYHKRAFGAVVIFVNTSSNLHRLWTEHTIGCDRSQYVIDHAGLRPLQATLPSTILLNIKRDITGSRQKKPTARPSRVSRLRFTDPCLLPNRFIDTVNQDVARRNYSGVHRDRWSQTSGRPVLSSRIQFIIHGNSGTHHQGLCYDLHD